MAGQLTRSGVASVVDGGLVECESEVAVMDELLGELVVRLKALGAVVGRLPPLAARTSQSATVDSGMSE